jgi:hypothetical protein
MHWWVWVLLGLMVVYLGSAVVEAFVDIRGRPTEPMAWCHKHGMFRKKHVLPWMGTEICPMCYYSAWKDAER